MQCIMLCSEVLNAALMSEPRKRRAVQAEVKPNALNAIHQPFSTTSPTGIPASGIAQEYS